MSEQDQKIREPQTPSVNPEVVETQDACVNPNRPETQMNSVDQKRLGAQPGNTSPARHEPHSPIAIQNGCETHKEPESPVVADTHDLLALPVDSDFQTTTESLKKAEAHDLNSGQRKPEPLLDSASQALCENLNTIAHPRSAETLNASVGQESENIVSEIGSHGFPIFHFDLPILSPGENLALGEIKLAPSFKSMVYSEHEKSHGKPRASNWGSFKKHYAEKVPQVCRGCGATPKDCVIELHHISPFHSDPAREEDETNVVWLCEGPTECHRLIGHSTNFRGINPHVLEDADHFKKRIDEMRERLAGEPKKG